MGTTPLLVIRAVRHVISNYSTCDKTHRVLLRDVLGWERVGLTAWH